MKRLSMLKLLTIVALLSVTLSANSTQDEKIKSFFSRAVSASKDYTLQKIEILKKESIKEAKGFIAYFVQMDLILNAKKRVISVNDIVFSNGEVLTKDLLDVETKRSIKSSLTLDIDESFYDEAHLIVGSLNAKYKLLVFSDPLCPSCMEAIPDMINFVKKNQKRFGLFYYNFPLPSHKGSKTLVKASIVAKKQGIQDVTLKVYEEVFHLEKTDEQSILDEFNKVLKTKITIQDITEQSVVDRLKADIEKANSVWIKGTPTLFINGKRDMSKKAYMKMEE